jgi:membrane protease YdiL (CAAX protease family)
VVADLLISLLVAFVEEATIRGVILSALAPLGARRAITISAVLFALPHLLKGFYADDWFLTTVAIGYWTFTTGMLYAWARIATGSIWPGLIAHACLDYALITASGGHFGNSSFTFDAFTPRLGS